MFTRINIERVKNEMSVKKLAEISGMKYDTLLMKLNGRSEFTRKEMLKIQSAFPEHVTLDELFCIDSEQRSA